MVLKQPRGEQRESWALEQAIQDICSFKKGLEESVSPEFYFSHGCEVASDCPAPAMFQSRLRQRVGQRWTGWPLYLLDSRCFAAWSRIAYLSCLPVASGTEFGLHPLLETTSPHL